MLQHRNSADRIDASRKAENHRRSAIADHTRSRLIPAAHRTAAIRTSGSRHARIVGGMETDHARGEQFIVDAFGDRRAAVFLERRGIEDAVSQLRIATLALDNARADFFGGEFQTFVGTGCAVVFAVSNKGTARKVTTVPISRTIIVRLSSLAATSSGSKSRRRSNSPPF